MNHSIGICRELAYLLGACVTAIRVNDDTHVVFDQAQNSNVLTSSTEEGTTYDIVSAIPFGKHRYSAAAGAQVGTELFVEPAHLIRR